MSDMEVHFSSKRDDWGTPLWFFRMWDDAYHFTVDVCALPHNAKCPRFYTPADDGLAQDWSGEVVWMNPPYGRGIKRWIEKAHEASLRGATVVALIPSRTDTKWWHKYIQDIADVHFIEGRLTFEGGEHPAPFPSAVVVWHPHN